MGRRLLQSEAGSFGKDDDVSCFPSAMPLMQFSVKTSATTLLSSEQDPPVLFQSTPCTFSRKDSLCCSDDVVLLLRLFGNRLFVFGGHLDMVSEHKLPWNFFI